MPEVCKKCIDASVNDCEKCEDDFITPVSDTADVYDEKEEGDK